MNFEEIKFSDQAFWQDPHAFWDQVREEQPVFWNKNLNAWVFSSYETVANCLSNDAVFSSARVVPQLEIQIPRVGGTLDEFAYWASFRSKQLLNLDGKDHARVKKYVIKAFSPQALKVQMPVVDEIVGEHIDNVAQMKQFNCVQDFSKPLAFSVISNVMGIPKERFPSFQHVSAETEKMMFGGDVSLDEALNIQELCKIEIEYLNTILEERRKNPKDDMISYLIKGGEESILDFEEVLFQIFSITNAGNMTTKSFFTSALYHLLSNPELLEQFIIEEDNIDNAIRELLRYQAPATFLNRVAKEDITVEGQHIKAGDICYVSIDAANHDQSIFPNPHEIDFHRDTAKLLTFGSGRHVCIGRFLAVHEIKSALVTMLKTIPTLKLDPDKPIVLEAWSFGAIIKELYLTT